MVALRAINVSDPGHVLSIDCSLKLPCPALPCSFTLLPQESVIDRLCRTEKPSCKTARSAASACCAVCQPGLSPEHWLGRDVHVVHLIIGVAAAAKKRGRVASLKVASCRAVAAKEALPANKPSCGCSVERTHSHACKRSSHHFNKQCRLKPLGSCT